MIENSESTQMVKVGPSVTIFITQDAHSNTYWLSIKIFKNITWAEIIMIPGEHDYHYILLQYF